MKTSQRQSTPTHGDAPERMRIALRGAVQGVGFRPFVYHLGRRLGLTGWVKNSPSGVLIEAEGPPRQIETFLLQLEKDKPPFASIQSLEFSRFDATGKYQDFSIEESHVQGEPSALVLPDIAPCGECLKEIFDPENRRHGYPFTNCTHCGPRFTLIESIPYDRPNTSMKHFTLCAACREEYENPDDRRFHAQPNSCWECGPALELWDPGGNVLARENDALAATIERLRRGRIVAVKGVGGFHLMVDAANEEAVVRLRQRKHREEKPFALMIASLTEARTLCDVSSLEERLLASPEAPIVLLKRKRRGAMRVAPSVAPGNPYLGLMLPSSPLHHLLLSGVAGPVVATSGNIADETLCFDEGEALKRLAGLADDFLVHDRPIVRHADDSIARILLGGEQVLRRARGYAPLPVTLREAAPPLLAVGGHLKNTVAVASGNHVFVSRHIGDLETVHSFAAFTRTVADATRLHHVEPETVVCDDHPDYVSTRFAREMGLPCIQIQHHLAHVFSCMAENELEGPVLGVCWDGAGHGPDGTLWGGEFLRVNAAEEGNDFLRPAHFHEFLLPGGETSMREPRRAAVGMLYELFGDNALSLDLPAMRSFSRAERKTLAAMLKQRINTPLACGVGRIFDAVASLLDLRQVSRFEGQAAMELEFALQKAKTKAAYKISVYPDPALPDDAGDAGHVADWGPMLLEILDDIKNRTAQEVIAAKFHHALARTVLAVARIAGLKHVVLTGGCFQNRYLTEYTVRLLERNGFCPRWHQRIPPNDGGLSLGQIVGAARLLNTRK